MLSQRIIIIIINIVVVAILKFSYLYAKVNIIKSTKHENMFLLACMHVASLQLSAYFTLFVCLSVSLSLLLHPTMYIHVFYYTVLRFTCWIYIKCINLIYRRKLESSLQSNALIYNIKQKAQKHNITQGLWLFMLANFYCFNVSKHIPIQILTYLDMVVSAIQYMWCVASLSTEGAIYIYRKQHNRFLFFTFFFEKKCIYIARIWVL